MADIAAEATLNESEAQTPKQADSGGEDRSDSPAASNPIDSNAIAAATITSSLTKKVDLLLKPTGDVPIMKKKKWQVDENKTVHWIISFIKRYLRLEDNETLFLYVAQAFAPSPDQKIKNLYDCFGTDGKLVLHYSKTPAWALQKQRVFFEIAIIIKVMRLSGLSGRSTDSIISFKFQYSIAGEEREIVHQIPWPLCPFVQLHEIGQHILVKHHIPARFEQTLLEQLDRFVDSNIESADQERFQRIQQDFHADFGTNKSLVLLQLNKLNLLRRNDSRAPSTQINLSGENEMSDNFRRFYYDLMHSSGQLGQALVSLENAFAERMADLFASNHRLLQQLAASQTAEMSTFDRRVGNGVSEADVNLLSAQHFAQMQQMRERCEEELQQSRSAQKEQFIQWIFNTYYDHQNGETKAAIERIESFVASNKSSNSKLDEKTVDDAMQESFTINLGAQLKSTHNLRLSTGNVLDLCEDQSRSLWQAHRLQTAMSLYSQPLTAIVILVNGDLHDQDSFGAKFRRICERTTEMHFASLSDQLYAVSQDTQRVMQTNRLSLGDIYVTRHSNLSQVHLAFHVVGEDSLHSSEINSRHLTILSLRNVLRMCYAHEVGVVSIPLLLINDESERITIQWAMKRAELVLKCVKGFMIEMCSLSSERDELKTVQFFVPKSISDDLFRSLALMVSTVFRVSNPLVLK